MPGGGFALDIHEGRFLREHHDLDAFTLNLLEILPDAMALYRLRGYAVDFLPDFDMLTIRKDGLHATFNRLEVDGETAMWRHIGNMGTVYFPAGWLDTAPSLFYGVPVFTAGIRFAYLLKTNPQLLNPEWTLLPKDEADIALLERILVEGDIDFDELCAQAWSISPYWVEQGYPEYVHPVLACKRE